ncbi:MAG: MDR family MFS transporter [Burkholderiaceae bacterium]
MPDASRTPAPMPAPSSRTDSDSDFQRAARSHAEIRSIVIGLMLAILLGALDQTIVSVALPRIAQQLRDFDLLAWVVSGYLVAVAVATPIYGKIGDLVGRRATLSFAIALFLLASVACALAQSMPMLVAARILQGLGGGGLISVAQAIIADVVAPRERGRYQGYVSGMYAIASVVGPLAGGVLTHYLSWRWIFWINLPLGAAALLISRRALATLPVPRVARRIDYPGAVLLSAGLTMLLVAITRVGQGVAWAAPLNLALFGAAAIVLAAFVWHETRAPEPILPLSLFRIPTVTLCCGVLFVAFFQVIALSVLVPLQLEMATGVGADGAAVRLVPLTLAIPLGAFTGGRLMSRVGRAKPFQLAGTALVPPAVLAIALIDPRAALPATLAMIAAGFGIGLQFPTSMVAVQTAVPARHIGVATATTAFFRSLGAAIGVAILTAILLASLQEHAPAGGAASGGEFLRHIADGVAKTGEAAQSIREAFRKIFTISAAVALASFCLTLRLRDETLADRLPR